jgi:hypothetical protein
MSTTTIPPKMRAAVIQRDGSACLKCRVPVVRHMDSQVRPDTIAFDHIRSEHRGGVTHPDNLQVLCTLCNQQKGAATRDYRVNKAPIPGFGTTTTPNEPSTTSVGERFGAAVMFIVGVIIVWWGLLFVGGLVFLGPDAPQAAFNAYATWFSIIYAVVVVLGVVTTVTATTMPHRD